jgi:hypothetical protein
VERVRQSFGIFIGLLYQANNEPRREAPALGDTIVARDSERFEPRLVAAGTLRWWGSKASTREAHVRGIQLLEENLSSAQRHQYKKCGYFDVIGGETGSRYRIRYGSEMNVQLLDGKGRPSCWLCFMPKGKLVVGDIMLAQKLALELFESQTLKVANTFSTDYSLFGPIA